MARTTEELNDILNRTVQEARRYFPISAAYLFGSYVENRAGDWSDIDVALFSPEAKRITLKDKVERLARIQVAVDAEIELHLYSDTRLDEASPGSICDTILADGRKIA